MKEQELTQEELTPEMKAQIAEIKEILDTPQIEPTMAINIIINAVQVCYDTTGIFNELDKALISKALNCFQDKVNKKEDFTIKVIG